MVSAVNAPGTPRWPSKAQALCRERLPVGRLNPYPLAPTAGSDLRPLLVVSQAVTRLRLFNPAGWGPVNVPWSKGRR